jgi:hypothetical protein
MSARQQAEEMVSQLTPQWLYEAAKRHEEVEKQMPPEFQHEPLENEGGMFLQNALVMLDVALPPDGEPHPKARQGVEDAMFAMLMGGICLGRLNEMRGGEAQEN